MSEARRVLKEGMKGLSWAFLASACAAKSLPPEATRTLSETQPLDFALKRFPQGTPFQLAQERGHPVLLEVWATWCKPCQASLPALDMLASEYAARGLAVYAVNVDEDPRLIQPFLNEHPVGLPVLLDEGARVAEQVLKLSILPSAFLLNAQGRLVYRSDGASEPMDASLRAAVEQLFEEK